MLTPSAPAALDVAGLTEMLGARVHEDVVVPRTTVRGRMRLVSLTEAAIINADAQRWCAATLGLEVDTSTLLRPGVMDRWNAVVAALTMAVAVRDPADESKPLCPADEWLRCDDDQIAAIWVAYKGMAARLDPLGESDEDLTQLQIDELRAAIKKKGVEVRSLFDFLMQSLSTPTSVDPPAS